VEVDPAGNLAVDTALLFKIGQWVGLVVFGDRLIKGIASE
jgi:hypothetical protein